MKTIRSSDEPFMRLALELAARGYGCTSPNPMVGAVLVKGGRIIGRGWHHRAGEPHAEIEALLDAHRRSAKPADATLYVTLEPCSTYGRMPPCTDAIISAKIGRVVVAAPDPNPAHAGKGLRLLKRAGISVSVGLLRTEANRLNEAFNHWIVARTPFVIVKAAMTLDGKIATSAGESKWITNEQSRAWGMHLRHGADAILVGVNTIINDNPSLTVRTAKGASKSDVKKTRRIILDSRARTPLNSRVLGDELRSLTTIVVGKRAPTARTRALARKVTVLRAGDHDRIDLPWLLNELGREEITSLLVEGGGQVNASFLLDRLAHRIAFFYAPKVLGDRNAIKAVAGEGISRSEEILQIKDVEYRRFGGDLFMTGLVGPALSEAKRQRTGRNPGPGGVRAGLAR